MSPRLNGDPRFRITFLAGAREQLAGILHRAAQVGRLPECLSAARLINQRLRTHPRIFGDLVRTHSHARIDERRAGIAPFFAYYGVHKEQPEVFIREFRDLL